MCGGAVLNAGANSLAIGREALKILYVAQEERRRKAYELFGSASDAEEMLNEVYSGVEDGDGDDGDGEGSVVNRRGQAADDEEGWDGPEYGSAGIASSADSSADHERFPPRTEAQSLPMWGSRKASVEGGGLASMGDGMVDAVSVPGDYAQVDEGVTAALRLGIFTLRLGAGTMPVLSCGFGESKGKLKRIVVGKTRKDPDRPPLRDSDKGMKIRGEGVHRSRVLGQWHLRRSYPGSFSRVLLAHIVPLRLYSHAYVPHQATPPPPPPPPLPTGLYPPPACVGLGFVLFTVLG
jgi:hypothetical protein